MAEPKLTKESLKALDLEGIEPDVVFSPQQE